MTDKIMKQNMKIFDYMRKAVLVPFSVLLLAVGCTKTYDYHYDSLYYIGPDGNTYCHMPLVYNIGNEAGRLLIPVCYSGEWTVSILEDVNWAFIDLVSGSGIKNIRFWYTGNMDGEERSATVKVSCDNGDEAEIVINQK